MGLSQELRDAIVKAILDDAKGGNKIRTARVVEVLKAQGVEGIRGSDVKLMATSMGLDKEVGPEKGKGTPSGTGGRMGGRPPGRKDAQARRTRSDVGQRRISPDVTPQRALDSYKQTKSLRKSAELLGISFETVRYLVAEARQKIITDDSAGN